MKKGLDNDNEESMDKNNNTEWKEVGGWKIVKRISDNNKKVKYKNFYSELDYNNNKNVQQDWVKLNYEKSYCKWIIFR